MNRKIKELALQANPASREIYESDNWQYNCAAWCAQDVEKFAELIVRECIDICNDTNDASYLNGVIAGRKIKEHFGVEE